MKHIIKTTLLIALTIGITYAGENRIAFLREKLITTPKEQAATKGNITKKLLAGVSIPIAFSYCLLNGFKRITPLMYSRLYEIPNLPPEAYSQILSLQNISENSINSIPPNYSLGLGSLITYYITHRLILSKLKKTAFLKFIKEWEFNKQYTPKEFHYAFEQLYNSDKPLDLKKVNDLKIRINKKILEKRPTKEKSVLAPSKIEKAKWEKLIQIFIKQPEIHSYNLKKVGIKLLGSSTISIAFWANLSLFFGAISPKTYSKSDANPGALMEVNKFFYNKFGLFLTSLPSFAFFLYAYKAMNAWVIAMEEQKALKNYLNNWEINKQDTPAKLIPLLDNAYLKYKENPDHVDLAETARIVKAFTQNKQIKNNKAQ